MVLLRTLHGWCGAALALALALIFFAGGLSVFAGDVGGLTAPRGQPAASDPVALGQMLQAYDRKGGPGIRVAVFAPHGPGVHRLFLWNGGGAYVDAQGRAIESWGKPGRFEEWVVALHNQFLLGDKGERLVGVIGLFAFAMGVSGLVLVVPAWRSLSLRLWPKSGARRDLLALHRTLGVILVIPLLLQTGTGAAMVFEGPLKHVLGLDVAEPPPLKAQAVVTGPAPWPRILAAAAATAPGGQIADVSAPWTPDGLYRVSLRKAGEANASTSVMVDASIGRAVQPPPAPPSSLGAWVFEGLLAVHSGAWGGLPTRIVLAIAAFGLGTTSLVGAWAFLQGRRRPTRGA
jgi:uncharacterized iron-regulated membrane protein